MNHSSNMQDNRNYVKTPHGYSAESLPMVETISPHMRKNIIEGKDVNLAALLIPYYSVPMNNDDRLSVDSCHNHKPDPRLNRNLNLNEFMKAFGIYKNVMCQAYPSRREKLDMYERDMVDMGYEYGGKSFMSTIKSSAVRLLPTLDITILKLTGQLGITGCFVMSL